MCFRDCFVSYNYRDSKELIRMLEREHEEKENQPLVSTVKQSMKVLASEKEIPIISQ